MEDRFLFRGKRIDNGEWVQGNLIRSNDAEVGYEAIIIPTNDSNMYTKGEGRGDLGFENWHRVDKDTICQCTGLKDKNGKMIWENDVCDRKEQYPEIVKYCNGDWTLDYSYASHKESGGCYCNLGFYAEERKCVEVIGNIFDNPELLEVQE
jgi:uncharacterized phage protein (TIGR01671 family)